MVIERTGWTWEYIDTSMDIPRLSALNKRWRKNPPLREMMQAYLGIEPEVREEPSGSIDDLFQMFGAPK